MVILTHLLSVANDYNFGDRTAAVVVLSWRQIKLLKAFV